MSINELFPRAHKSCYDAKSFLSSLSSNPHSSSDHMFLILDDLDSQLSILSGLVNRETPANREIWQRKIEELRIEAVQLRRDGNFVRDSMMRRRREEEDRQRLFEGSSYAQRRDDMNDMQHLAEEGDSLQRSRWVGMRVGLGVWKRKHGRAGRKHLRRFHISHPRPGTCTATLASRLPPPAFLSAHPSARPAPLHPI